MPAYRVEVLAHIHEKETYYVEVDDEAEVHRIFPDAANLGEIDDYGSEFLGVMRREVLTVTDVTDSDEYP